MQVILTKLQVGQGGSIKKLGSSNQSYRKKLLSLGLIPGTQIQVTRYAPMGDPIEVLIRGTRVSLRKEEANIILVELAQE